MSEQIEAQNKENLRVFFATVLGKALDVEVLDRALSAFLSDNYGFSDFNLRFDPPLILTEDKFKALVMGLIDYFDDIGFTGIAERIFMVMVRATPENKSELQYCLRSKILTEKPFM
jgi:hypothetical protein